jgi:hypothetical protein
MRARGRWRRTVCAGESSGDAADAEDAADRDDGGMSRASPAGRKRLPGVTDSRCVTVIDAEPTLRRRNLANVAT